MYVAECFNFYLSPLQKMSESHGRTQVLSTFSHLYVTSAMALSVLWSDLEL